MAGFYKINSWVLLINYSGNFNSEKILCDIKTIIRILPPFTFMSKSKIGWTL